MFPRFSTKLVLSSAIVLAAFAGCKKEESTVSTPAATPSASMAGGNNMGKGLKVGFAQIGAESAWRTANTQSIKDEAQKRGIDLKFVDAQGKQENQITAIRSFITDGVDVIVLAPVVATGFEPVLKEAKDAGIPVILSDRKVDVTDESLYATFIGADFIEEGRRAAEYMIKKTEGKAMIAELEGTSGAAPANDRKKGFHDEIAKHAGMKVLMSQTGDFNRAKGKEVMEAFLKSPEGKNITAVYAHNDDMALGAIQAIEAAGKKPGTDIIIVSIDGVKDAFQAMVDGKLNCSVECNPMIGGQVFDAVAKIKAGDKLDKHIAVEEGVFPQEKAKEALPTRKY